MRYLFIKGAIASEIKNDILTIVCIINVMTKKMLRDDIPRVLYNANDLILRLKKSCESAYITPASRIIRKNKSIIEIKQKKKDSFGLVLNQVIQKKV